VRPFRVYAHVNLIRDMEDSTKHSSIHNGASLLLKTIDLAGLK